MRVAVRSILFRQLTKSNADAFLGNNRGEYDLRYGRLPAITAFTADIPEEKPTKLGGWTKTLPIEAFTGPNPVPAATLPLRYMGPSGARSQDTYIASQTSKPYPLWAPSRVRPGKKSAADLEGDVALVLQDASGAFHARWVKKEHLAQLPEALRQAIAEQKGAGVFDVPDVQGSAASPRVVGLVEALRRHHNVLLYGPPGTGKTHLVNEVRRHFSSSGLWLDTDSETGALGEAGGGDLHHAWATFHQSYSYEDFLVGLRPQPIAGGGFDLVPRAGILLELAEWARQAGRESLLVVDEINRGNVSRIFGEFITLMEPDKRLADDGGATDRTIEVRLPFVDAAQTVDVDLPDGKVAKVPVPFTMPRRVYTLATMNSVDKSVAPLDAALRRRFHVITVFPDLAEFRSRLGLGAQSATRALVPQHPTTAADVKWTAVALLEVLNSRLTLFLGTDFQLGEWFLEPLIDASSATAARAALADVWRTALMPQLEDYFVGRSEQLAKTLGDPADDEPALVVDSPDTAFSELGAVRSLRAATTANEAELLRFMAKIARSGLPAVPAADSSDTLTVPAAGEASS